MNKRAILSLIGFILFAVGFLSLIFTLINVSFTFLSFLDNFPSPFGFVTKLVLMFGGMIMLYMSKSDNNPYA